MYINSIPYDKEQPPETELEPELAQEDELGEAENCQGGHVRHPGGPAPSWKDPAGEEEHKIVQVR